MDVMRTRYVKRMEKCSVASSEVSGHFARSNSMALIFSRPDGSQMFRSAQFFMNIKRGRKSINHGVAYKASSLSLVIENQHFNSAKPR